jgi:3-dehydrosphinganine reductase
MSEHAIITGGSSGIGLALARRLAGRGLHVTLIARDPGRLEQARGAVLDSRRDERQAVHALSADVTDEPALSAAIGQAVALAGAPRFLILSAGIAVPGYFGELPGPIFRETMEINYFGTLNAVRAAVPAMRGGGRIIMISSGAGLIGLFGYSAYSPSKFALRGLAEALDAELRRDGIRVSIAFPPDTDTPQLARENLTKPRETYIMNGSAATWSPDDVADVILRGADRGRFAITPGWEMALLNRFGGVLAPILQSLWARKTAAMKG